MTALNGCCISDYDAPFLRYRNLPGSGRRFQGSPAQGAVLHV